MMFGQAFKLKNSLLTSKEKESAEFTGEVMRLSKRRASRNALLGLALNGWRGKTLPNRFKAAELTRPQWSYLK